MKDGQHKIHHSQRQRGSFEGSQRKISHSKIHHTQHEGRFPHKGVCHCMSILGKRRKLRDPIQVWNCLLCSILHKQIHEGWHEFQNHVRQYFGACSRQMVFKNKSAYNRYFPTALQADMWRQKCEDPSLPITCEMLCHLHEAGGTCTAGDPPYAGSRATRLPRARQMTRPLPPQGRSTECSCRSCSKQASKRCRRRGCDGGGGGGFKRQW